MTAVGVLRLPWRAPGAPAGARRAWGGGALEGGGGALGGRGARGRRPAVPVVLAATNQQSTPQGKAMSSNDRLWEAKFEELREYRAEHGDCLVPQRWKAAPGLGKWVYAQRKKAKDDKLLPERFGRLDELGFAWDSQSPKDVWDEMFEALVAFKEEHGHVKPGRADGSSKLSKWVREQRKKIRAGLLSPNRAARLEALGVVAAAWVNEWEGSFAELAAFKKEHGHFRVTSNTLNVFLCRVRQQRARGKLDPEREARLEALGMEWDVAQNGGRGKGWDNQYIKLVEFYVESGHSEVGPDHELFKWSEMQRDALGMGALSQEKIQALDEIEFPWWVDREEHVLLPPLRMRLLMGGTGGALEQQRGRPRAEVEPPEVQQEVQARRRKRRPRGDPQAGLASYLEAYLSVDEMDEVGGDGF